MLVFALVGDPRLSRAFLVPDQLPIETRLKVKNVFLVFTFPEIIREFIIGNTVDIRLTDVR
jgi:hypothetical protein